MQMGASKTKKGLLARGRRLGEEAQELVVTRVGTDTATWLAYLCPINLIYNLLLRKNEASILLFLSDAMWKRERDAVALDSSASSLPTEDDIASQLWPTIIYRFVVTRHVMWSYNFDTSPMVDGVLARPALDHWSP